MNNCMKYSSAFLGLHNESNRTMGRLTKVEQNEGFLQGLFSDRAVQGTEMEQHGRSSTTMRSQYVYMNIGTYLNQNNLNGGGGRTDYSYWLWIELVEVKTLMTDPDPDQQNSTNTCIKSDVL